MAIDPVNPASSAKPLAPASAVTAAAPAQAVDAAAALSRASEVDATSAAFAVAGAARVGGSDQVSAFTLFKARIQDGIRRNLSREAILDDLIAFETSRAFGNTATREMREKVADHFRTDPRLADLFGSLLNASK